MPNSRDAVQQTLASYSGAKWREIKGDRDSEGLRLGEFRSQTYPSGPVEHIAMLHVGLLSEDHLGREEYDQQFTAQVTVVWDRATKQMEVRSEPRRSGLTGKRLSPSGELSYLAREFARRFETKIRS
jgi:hypothetical protein